MQGRGFHGAGPAGHGGHGFGPVRPLPGHRVQVRREHVLVLVLVLFLPLPLSVARLWLCVFFCWLHFWTACNTLYVIQSKGVLYPLTATLSLTTAGRPSSQPIPYFIPDVFSWRAGGAFCAGCQGVRV